MPLQEHVLFSVLKDDMPLIIPKILIPQNCYQKRNKMNQILLT